MSTYSVFSSTMMHQPLSSKKCSIRVVLWLIIFCLISAYTYAQESTLEYYSSTDKLQKLVNIETGLVDAFRKYIQTQEEEFSHYHKFIEHVKSQHSEAAVDMEGYLGNPINAFTLIKRMVVDWNHLHQYVKENDAGIGLRQAIDKIQIANPLPTDKEIKGAVGGLARLQEVYNLEAEDLMHGEINGKYYDAELQWRDCFEIATQLYDMRNMHLAISWLNVTLQLLDEIEDEEELNLQKYKIDSLEYMALAHYDIGFPERAVIFVDKLLKIVPNHTFKELRSYMLSVPPRIDNQIPDVYTYNMTIEGFDWYANYTRLCRGYQVPEKKHHQLKCRIDTKNKPAFILAPLQVEELSLDPEITHYHNVLKDKQIEKILDKAKDYEIERSGVQDGKESVVAEVRVSQQTWLLQNISLVSKLYELVGDISGLNMETAEDMQVANYGIGGQYDPHHDFFEMDDWPDDLTSNRISTAMFYFSDVEQGGYTTFPYLNVYLRPEKGSLVLWHNLHKSSAEDFRMLHGGCPVLKGSKKIGNIWIHDDNQVFTRPCELIDDKHKSIDFRQMWP